MKADLHASFFWLQQFVVLLCFQNFGVTLCEFIHFVDLRLE